MPAIADRPDLREAARSTRDECLAAHAAAGPDSAVLVRVRDDAPPMVAACDRSELAERLEADRPDLALALAIDGRPGLVPVLVTDANASDARLVLWPSPR